MPSSQSAGEFDCLNNTDSTGAAASTLAAQEVVAATAARPGISDRMSLRVQALRPIGKELAKENDEDDRDIDFGSVGLYLVGLQVVATLLICALISVLCCWLLPPRAVSAVRTLSVVSIVAILLVRKPLRVGRPRGVAAVFNCLRPAVAVYVLSMVFEQLVYTCVAEDAIEPGSVRTAAYHGTTVVLLFSGMVRARWPQSETDGPFLVTTVATAVIALLPPAASEQRAGPLCDPATLLEAGERVLRAVLFGGVYVALAYAAAPARNASDECFVCIMRATAASLWVLCIGTWGLILAPVQVAIILISRLGEDDGESGATSRCEFVPLHGAQTPECPLSELSEADAELGLGVNGMVAVGAGELPKTPGSGGLRFALSNVGGGHGAAGAVQPQSVGTSCGAKDGFGLTSAQLSVIAARAAADS